MAKARWYLICYDIRNVKRLQKVHYFLSRRGLALQYSVFLVRQSPKEYKSFQQALKDRLRPEDDCRSYPLASLNSLWLAGSTPIAVADLFKAKNETPLNL